ncbi:MAG: quinone-dependent dihydroorotate dehydrogenase [Pseudomonadales bacterium]|nr:quinone-dependent dihydroorotate dehydrogenase [Pseudomonadales bacterium]
MSSLLFRCLRFFLFLLPAETSHEWGLKGLALLQGWHLGFLLRPKIPALPVQALGLSFPNPVGLAAGLDKNADYIDALGALGFGFIEVGTVTPKPQAGNPKPRLFRLRRERAIINRMGFNNLGVEHLVKNLERRRYCGIVGVNIGKNLTTEVQDAAQDYLACLRAVYKVADYVVVNLSSPNTPGLRSLQFGEPLAQLLRTLQDERETLRQATGRRVPLLLKVAPDLSEAEARGIARTVAAEGFDGLIATNTTLSRAGVEHSPHGNEAGGLSGAPLTGAATAVLHQLWDANAGRLPLIGVGGIMQGSDAAAKAEAGASLVQIYSGFIYRGPALIRDCVRALQTLRHS